MNMIALFTLVILTSAIAAATAPKRKEPAPASIETLEIPTAQNGSVIPVIYGTVTLNSPNVVWYGDLGYTPVRTKGGK